MEQFGLHGMRAGQDAQERLSREAIARVAEYLNREVERVNNTPHGGFLLVERRHLLRDGKAFKDGRTIYVPCIYPFIFQLEGETFEEKLDMCFAHAKRNIAEDIEAIMAKYVRQRQQEERRIEFETKNY
jgi:hypothetical protein